MIAKVHLSEAINRADLSDAPALRQFVESELILGLEVALEDQILNGGTQTQPWATDLLTTARQAITKLEAQGLTASGFVFAPADWERVELAANSGGYYAAQAGQAVPIDRAARRLWGVPVALSTSQAPGSGWVTDFAGSTQLHLREDAVIDWSESLYSPDRFGAGEGGNLFEANQVVFRCELRAGLDVLRPLGIVEIDLAAGWVQPWRFSPGGVASTVCAPEHTQGRGAAISFYGRASTRPAPVSPGLAAPPLAPRRGRGRR